MRWLVRIHKLLLINLFIITNLAFFLLDCRDCREERPRNAHSYVLLTKNPVIYNYYLYFSHVKEFLITNILVLLLIINSPGTLIYSILHWKPTKLMLSCIKTCSNVLLLSRAPVTKVQSSLLNMHPPFETLNIQKLESIQRTAARFCFNNFLRHCSVTNLLSLLWIKWHLPGVWPALLYTQLGRSFI